MTDAPAQIVRDFLSAVEAKDIDRSLTYLSADCAYTNKPIGTVTGREGARSVLEPFFGKTIRNELRVLREATIGSTVFVERLDRHLIETGWVELPVTGIAEVVDGKIVSLDEYFDFATLTRQWPGLAG